MYLENNKVIAYESLEALDVVEIDDGYWQFGRDKHLFQTRK